MLSTLQKNLPALSLMLTALLGLSLGCLGAAITGSYLRPGIQPGKTLAGERTAPTRKPLLTDYQVILQRNIFDSTAPGAGTLTDAETPGQTGSPAAPRANLTLFGTVVAGAGSLAVIHTGQEIKAFRLDDELPGGGRLEEIARNLIQIRYPGGPLETLHLYQGEGPKGSPPAPVTGRTAGAADASIKAIGENRWVIPREVAEQARGNLNELLRTARMEPNIVEGRTEGFVVRMIRPKSLLDTLGILRGDIISQINGMPLDGPEKALLVFQQLREAKQLSIGLIRNGTPMNFEYEVE
jgi:general secretion pathway protein C